METNYTKGPWKASIHPLESRNNDDAGTIWRDLKEGSTLIAVTSKSPGIDEGKANAQLIAAAPDLLEAIKYYFDVLEEVRGRDWNKNPDHVLSKMISAVNKATGK